MSSLNLLDEALLIGGGGRSGSITLIEDCVETTGAFVLHHLLKRSLSNHPLSPNVVVFLSLAHSFSHYDRILRKMGCNLAAQRDNKKLLFLEMLMLQRSKGDKSEDLLLALFGEIQKAVEVCSSPEGLQHITVIIDDISLMEVEANGSSNLVLDFVHYCCTLTAQFGCSLITLNHEDVYISRERPALLLQLEYLADVVVKVEPLATGLAADVHGQLTVVNKGVREGYGKSSSRVHDFQFKIKDSSVEYFYPGSRT